MVPKIAYSYLTDPNVPAFDGGETFAVMDAQCGLCARGARWIARNDRQERFKIVPAQSDVGLALFRHYGLDPDDPASWLFIEQGVAHTSLSALIRVGHCLGGVWRGLTVLNILPLRHQNALYGWIARNRYRFFGRANLCALPDPEIQKRLVK